MYRPGLGPSIPTPSGGCHEGLPRCHWSPNRYLPLIRIAEPPGQAKIGSGENPN